jgi:hypothetical protein
MHTPLKLVSHAIVFLMGAAVVYAFYIAVTYWSGIGV